MARLRVIVADNEIDCLRCGENGMMRKPLDVIVEATQWVAQHIITDHELRRRLAAAAKADSVHNTVSNMAQNFLRGLLAALALPVR